MPIGFTKHDGCRMIVRQDGPIVRLYTRNAYDCTVRLPATAAVAGHPGFMNDGEALAVGPTAIAVPQASSV
jgi:ATP-dependent DNA ligase